MQNAAQSREKTAIWVSITNIAANIILSVFKLAAGILARSGAMISDGVHTLSDALSTLIVIGGIKLAAKSADQEHPYGHERFESVAAILLSIILAITGVSIGWAGIRQIIAAAYGDLMPPGMLALVAAVFSILVKEGMYWRARHYAKKLNSGALMADAWHNRSDALSSIGSFAGVLGARLGFPVLDPLASVLICLFIVKVAVDIFRDAINKMTDRAIDQATEAQIRALVEAHPGVIALDLLHSRLFGDRAYVDIEITLQRDLLLHEAHDIAQKVEYAVEEAFPTVKHCMVHMNPTAKDS